MRAMRFSVSFSVLIAVLSTVSAQRVLYVNGRVFTADSSDSFASYFVTEGGRFTEVGHELPPDRLTSFDRRVDLGGATVIPGIVDSHIHFIDGGLGMLQVSFFDVADHAEMQSRIRETKDQLLDGIYVGRDLGYPPLQGIAEPLPFLDGLFPDVPAVIFLKSGHGAIANSAAMELMGFTPRTRIADGTIGSNAQGGLTGYLFEGAAMEASKQISGHYSAATIERAVLRAQHKALAYGITTIGDNTFSPYHLNVYQQLQRHGLLKLRVWARSYGRIPQTAGLMAGLGQKKLRLIPSGVDLMRVHYHAMKFFEDMSLSVPADAAQAQEPGGRVFLDEAELKDLFLLHPEQTLAFHVQGEQGLGLLLNAIGTYGPRLNAHRHVIDHAGYASPDQVRRIHELGLGVTIIGGQLFDHEALARYYGRSMQGTARTFLPAQLLDTRTKVVVARGALSSDFPYGMDTLYADHPELDGLNPFAAMAVNVTGRHPDGTPIAGVGGKTINVREAVRSYTANGAYVLGAEQAFGTIAAGRQADFVVLDRAVFEADAMDLYRTTVQRTFIQGEEVYNASDTTVGPSVLSAPVKVGSSDYAISPVIGYDPTLGLILGGAYFRFPLRTPGSYFSTQLQAILTGQVNVMLDYTRYSLFKRADLAVAGSFSDYFQYYFGEGSSTDADVYTKLFASVYKVRPELSYDLHRGWRSTVFADLRGRHETKQLDHEDMDLGRTAFPDEHTLGLGATIQGDTRDNPFSTRKGILGRLEVMHVPSDLNVVGNGAATLFQADLRAFRYLYSARYVLAARLFGGYAIGDPSYLFRYTLGGAYILRGFYGNRFRGSRFYAGQLEMRFNLIGRFGGAGFVDAGDIGDGELNRMRLSYGGGIRFALTANVKLRLDYGTSNDQSGVFFTFGEAF